MAERPDMNACLSQIDVPTLLICGQEDVITPPEEMQALARDIRGAETALIPHAGHLAPLEQPADTNRVIRRFLERLGK